MAGYTAPADAFGAGVERGVRIVGNLNEDRRREDENQRRKVESERKWQLDTEDRDRRRRKDEWDIEDREDKQAEADLKLLEGPYQGARAELQDLIARHGTAKAVPPELLGPVTQRMKEAGDAYDEGLQRLRRPRLERMRKKDLEYLKSFDPATADPDRTARAIATVTRRPVTDFMTGPNGEPPLVKQAEMAMLQAMDTGDKDSMVAAANILFRPELETGIGTRGRDGLPIVKKEIIGFAPSPDGDGKLIPVFKVTTEGGAYAAGLTKSRSSRDGDPFTAVDVGEALERVGYMATMAEAINSPQMRAVLDKRSPQADATAEEALKQYHRLGGYMKEPAGKFETQKTDFGDRIRTEVTDKNTGELVRSKTEARGINPDRSADRAVRIEVAGAAERGKTARAAAVASGKGGKPSALRDRLAAIDAEYENGDIDDEERLRLRRQALGGAPKRDPESADVRADYTTQWGRAGFDRDKDAPSLDEFVAIRKAGLPSGTKVLTLPKSEKQLVKGEVYRTKQGLGKWNGTKFEGI